MNKSDNEGGIDHPECDKESMVRAVLVTDDGSQAKVVYDGTQDVWMGTVDIEEKILEQMEFQDFGGGIKASKGPYSKLYQASVLVSTISYLVAGIIYRSGKKTKDPTNVEEVPVPLEQIHPKKVKKRGNNSVTEKIHSCIGIFKDIMIALIIVACFGVADCKLINISGGGLLSVTRSDIPSDTTVLNASVNHLDSIPENITVSELHSVILSHNEFQTIPKFLESSNTLYNLDMSYNRLTTIDTVGLELVTVLSATNNFIDELPCEVLYNLTSLWEGYFSGNRIRAFPYCNFSKIRHLDLRNNPLVCEINLRFFEEQDQVKSVMQEFNKITVRFVDGGTLIINVDGCITCSTIGMFSPTTMTTDLTLEFYPDGIAGSGASMTPEVSCESEGVPPFSGAFMVSLFFNISLVLIVIGLVIKLKRNGERNPNQEISEQEQHELESPTNV